MIIIYHSEFIDETARDVATFHPYALIVVPGASQKCLKKPPNGEKQYSLSFSFFDTFVSMSRHTEVRECASERDRHLHTYEIRAAARTS